MFCHVAIGVVATNGPIENILLGVSIRTKDENIDFDGYIDTCILRIYRRYIDEYFYMNINISEIKLL